MKFIKKFWFKYGPFVLGLLGVGLLFFVLLLNTHLSRLSLTGDFDGRDFEKILKLRGYLDILKVDTSGVSDETLRNFINETIHTEVIVRDFEMQLNNSLCESIIQTKKNTSNDRGDYLESKIVRLDTMLLMRERAIFPDVIGFWRLYKKKVDEYLLHNDVIGLVTHILISPLLYVGVFLLAFILTLFVLWRLWRRYRTNHYVLLIEPHLKNKNMKELELTHQKKKWKFVGIGVKQFVDQFFKTTEGMLSVTSYENILLEDDNETEHFTRTTDLINTWILRLGILGTLFGIMLAFYEVAKAVPLIKYNELTPEFKLKIREALTGHAVSVVTALAAQATSILYEIVSLKSTGISLSKDWLLKQSRTHIENGGGEKGKSNQVISELNETLQEAKNLKDKYDTMNKDTNTIAENISKAAKDVLDTTGNISIMKVESGKVQEKIDGINGTLNRIEKLSITLLGNIWITLSNVEALNWLLDKTKSRMLAINRYLKLRWKRFGTFFRSLADLIKSHLGFK